MAWFKTMGRAQMFLVFFALICALKWSVLNEPPVGDTAMGLFPPAIALSETNFDIIGLLQQPNFSTGGPNVHSTSLVTLMTAILLHWMGYGPTFIVVLHVIHFAFAAFALTQLFGLAQSMLSNRLAVAVCAAVLCFPLFLTQAGYMYMEVPLLICTLGALSAFAQERRGRAAGWAAVAVLVKQAGLIVGAALAVAALLERRPLKNRLATATLCVLWPLLWVAAQAIPIPPFTPGAHWPGGSYRFFLQWNVWKYLVAVPDLLALSGLFWLVGMVWGLAIWRTLRGGPTTPAAVLTATPQGDRTLALSYCLVACFGAFYLCAPLAGTTVWVLPRYYVQVVPLLFLGLTAFAARAFSSRAALGGLAALSIAFLANRHGEFYPRELYRELSVVERSEAYSDLLKLQREALTAVAELPSQQTVFLGFDGHYMASHPAMGILDHPLENGRLVMREPYRNARLSDFPDSFYMLRSCDWLGGQEMAAVLKQAAADTSREVQVVRTFHRGGFEIDIVHVGRRTVATRPENQVAPK